MDEPITLEFDGGARGNPGPAGIGVVLRAKDGTELVTLGRFIGRATNNVAEYKALITGLELAKGLGATKLIIRGDSELIIKQMTGVYRVKHPAMRALYDEAKFLIHQFDHVNIEHNLRHKNELADRLANLAMDKRRDVTDADTPAGGPSGSSAGPSSSSPLDEPSPVAPKPGDRFACGRCGCVIRLEKPSSIRPHQLKPFVCQCGGRMGSVEGSP